jgi:uncharacterized membrane protein (UPF0127 family)
MSWTARGTSGTPDSSGSSRPSTRLLVDGRDVAEIEVADTYLRRLRGMLGTLRVTRPLLLSPCSSVHGMGMLIPLDVALLDRELRVVHVTTLWPMGFVRPRRGVHSALEAARGDLARWGVVAGSTVTLAPAAAPEPPRA